MIRLDSYSPLSPLMIIIMSFDIFSLCIIFYFEDSKMEEAETLKLSLKIQHELDCSRIKGGPNEQVVSHCKRDHLSPSPFDDRKHVSNYLHSHSPNKQAHDYNNPQINKDLQKFRRHQSSLPTLPSILATSNYQNSFHQPLLETPAKGK